MSQTITVPIFPLDGVLLIPGLAMRLYIFEPRYQEMLSWALEHDARIAMATPSIGHSAEEEHQPPIHTVAGLGEVTAHQIHDNGHADIELQGLSRVRIIEELPQAWQFRLVHAELLSETVTDTAALARELPVVLQFLQAVDPGVHAQLDGLSPQQIIDLALVRLPVEPAVRLHIYSEPEPLRRLRMITQVLDQRPPSRPAIEIDRHDPRRN